MELVGKDRGPIHELISTEGAALPGERLGSVLDEGEILARHLAWMRTRGLGDEDHLGAECTHHPRPLSAVSFRHDGDELMAEHGAHDGQSGAGVSARELDHRLARLKLARRDGVLDDLPGNAVLLREPRV